MKMKAVSHHPILGLQGTLALFAMWSSITHCGSDPTPQIVGSGKDGGSGASGMSGSSGNSGGSGTGASGGALGSSGSGGAAGASSADASSDVADSASDASEDGGSSDAFDAAEDVFVDRTVRGTLKTPRGQPVEGITVLIGQSTTVSNARGEFTFDNVPPTYDLLILPNASKGAITTQVYIGLTSRRPFGRVVVGETFLRTTVQGMLSIQGSGPPGYPQQPFQRTAVGFKATSQNSSATLLLRGDESAGQGPSYGPLDVAWTVDQTIAGQLLALQWRVGTTPFPTGYSGWITQPTSLTDGTVATANLALGPVAQREITGTVRFPQATQSLEARLAVETLTVFNNSVTFAAGTTSVAYQYLIPTLGNVARVLSFRATPNGSLSTSELEAKVVDTTATFDFELPPAPSLASPVDRAMAVDSNTEFVWTAVPNAIYRMAAVSSTGTSILIHTATTTGRIPDLASKGVPLGHGNHIWTVEATGPAASVDAFVSAIPILEDRGQKFAAVSPYRNFTTRTP
jgi:hypothetical protein